MKEIKLKMITVWDNNKRKNQNDGFFLCGNFCVFAMKMGNFSRDLRQKT